VGIPRGIFYKLDALQKGKKGGDLEAIEIEPLFAI